MRHLLGISLGCAVMLLVLVARAANAGPASADPASWPSPNPDPNWYYYDLGPSDPNAYQPVTIAQIVADPFKFDGQLIRVQGTFRSGGGMRADCPPRPAASQSASQPTVEPGFLPLGLATAVADPSGELGILIWGKNGDSFGAQDQLAVPDGDQIELRGILRASYRNVACNPERQMASAYLAIQRTDPIVPFTQSAQALQQHLTRGPQQGQQPRSEPAPEETHSGGGAD